MTLTLGITKSCGRILKDMGVPEYLTCLERNWMWVKKQELEQDMEKWIGSKLDKKYDKAVYCQPVYLTSMENTYMHAMSLQSCLTLCNPNKGICSPPGSSLYWILQARILEWIALPFSKGSS